MRFKLKIIFYCLKILLRKKIRSRKQLASYQDKQLKRFADSVLRRSALYLPYFKGSEIEWSQMPKMSKGPFMNNFNLINTCGIRIEEAMPFALEAEKSRAFNSEINGITVGLSTGTSGQRGLFLVSENERAQWVALVMTRVIKPRLLKKQKIAFFLRADSNLYSSVASSLFEFKYFDIFKPLEDLLADLNQFSPDIIAAQPSLLMDICEASQQGKVNLKVIQIISFAEVLYKENKEHISKVLQATVTEVYQCTEGFLGVTCKEGTMHLNEDFIKIDKEWIDETSFYPIITDFSRSSQPVVNYKLNDVLKIKKEGCKCGSPLEAIEQIIGRDDDVLIFQEKKIYSDLFVRRIAIECSNFQNYLIIQTDKNKLEVQIECKEDQLLQLELDFKKAISMLLADFGIIGIEINVIRQTVRIPGNKLRKTINKVCE